MNININPNPPGGGSAPTLRYGVPGRWPGVSGNSRSRDHQISAMFYKLAIQLGFDLLNLSSEERNLLESMANAMVPLDPLPDQGTPRNIATTRSTTTEGPRGEIVGGTFDDRIKKMLERNESMRNIKSGGGSMPGFGGAPTTQDGPLLWDDSKNKGDGNKAISVGGNEPATNQDLEDIINGYKSRRNAPTPPLMSPPPTTPTTPPGGSATGSAATNNYGMGNYTSASLAEMLQQLLGRRGGFGGGWRV